MDKPYLCLDCMQRWAGEQLDPLPDNWEQMISKIDPTPEGACPDCGELVWHDAIKYI